MLRLMWFLDFVSNLLRQVHDDRDKGISASCKEAYNIALAPHHPFVVRTAAKIAMAAAPNRKNLLKLLFGDSNDLTEDQKYKHILEWKESMDKIAKELWTYYKSNNLTELP